MAKKKKKTEAQAEPRKPYLNDVARFDLVLDLPANWDVPFINGKKTHKEQTTEVLTAAGQYFRENYAGSTPSNVQIYDSTNAVGGSLEFNKNVFFFVTTSISGALVLTDDAGEEIKIKPQKGMAITADNFAKWRLEVSPSPARSIILFQFK